MRAAAGKARFYTGPAESGGGSAAAAAAAAAALAADDGDDAAKDSRYAVAAATDVWKLTPEEVEEERLLRESLPAAYGGYDAAASPVFSAEDVAAADGGSGGLGGGDATAVVSHLPRIPSASRPSPLPEAAAAAGAGAAQRRPAAAEGRRRRVQEGAQNDVRRRWAGGHGGAVGAGVGAEEGSGGSDDVLSAAVLEGENRDLVARMKNELDDARLVETKMSEASLFVLVLGGGEPKPQLACSRLSVAFYLATRPVVSAARPARVRFCVVGRSYRSACTDDGLSLSLSVCPRTQARSEESELKTPCLIQVAICVLTSLLVSRPRLRPLLLGKISGLMGLFASKVVEQQEGMEHVFDAAVSANEKVVRGGQHLEKAAQRGGAFRLFYVWFMVGASFCLLFLHFYNP